MPRIVRQNLTCNEVLARLKSIGDPLNVEGMAQFKVFATKAFGVSTPEIRRLARSIEPDHELAQALWNSGWYEARVVAGLIDVPAEVTSAQMERWAKDFDSWAIVDGTCGNLFIRTPHAWTVAFTWCEREEEFIRRAGFSMFAYLAVHDKQANDRQFRRCFASIEKYAHDPRNFVKKAVNWALRQIGKRNRALHVLAIECAQRVKAQNTPAARWIAADALRELQSPLVARMLARKAKT